MTKYMFTNDIGQEAFIRAMSTRLAMDLAARIGLLDCGFTFSHAVSK